MHAHAVLHSLVPAVLLVVIHTRVSCKGGVVVTCVSCEVVVRSQTRRDVCVCPLFLLLK
jgi:hypothetical protein